MHGIWQVVLILSLALPARAAERCERLTALSFPNTTITGAATVAAGAFHLPPDAPPASPEFFTAFDRLPSFCRVQATIAPSADSHIEVEVWLPASHWNGRFLGVGNGGYGGSFGYYRLGEALDGGYATASTDTGHKGTFRESQWAVGHPEKQIDFDYRAIHEMTALAKAAMRAYYGREPEHSYFHSCSNGGRQGLMEAERYPADYDGIMAGAPAISWGFTTFVSGALDAFRDRGGKLIVYHGGDDEPESSVRYYQRLVARERFVRLYVVPGMGHCGSGAVPNDFRNSMLAALERWIEHGAAPKSIIATQYNVDGVRTSGVLRTRPLCPYPEEARWRGRGNPNDAANYDCR